jgi:hypothetical protein
MLPQSHQDVVKNFMKMKCRLIVGPKYGQQVEIERFYQYLCHLFTTHDVLDEEEKAEVMYRNYLQSPL